MKKKKREYSYTPAVVYRGVSIYDSGGEYWFYINAFRFCAESIGEAENIIDRYAKGNEEFDEI